MSLRQQEKNILKRKKHIYNQGTRESIWKKTPIIRKIVGEEKEAFQIFKKNLWENSKEIMGNYYYGVNNYEEFQTVDFLTITSDQISNSVSRKKKFWENSRYSKETKQ